jgi:tetratricopeptide (TPR) repeat protein
MPALRTLRNAGRFAFAGLLLLLVGFGLWLVSWHLLAEYHLRQAARALERQRYRRALEEYREALRYRPASAALHLCAGRTARRAGDIPTAREHLRRCWIGLPRGWPRRRCSATGCSTRCSRAVLASAGRRTLTSSTA